VTAPVERVFKLIDISDPNNVKITDLALPPEVTVDVPAEARLSIVEWDSSSNYVLIGLGADIIRLDRREPSSSQNISRLFGATLSDPHFQGGNNNLVFALTDKALRRFDIAAKTTSAPLVSGVENYKLFGDGKLAYSAVDGNQQIVGFFYGDKNYIIKTYDQILPTLVDFTHYYREDFFVLARGEQLEVIKWPFGNDHEITTVEMPGGVDYLTHNGSGRMIIAGGGNQVFSFDLETSENFQFDTEEFAAKPFWLDDYHLGYTSGGQLKMIEFDGANRETLVAAVNFGVFSGNNEHLFTFAALPDGLFLQDSAMLVE
jgi:hypothetical protein